MSLFGCFSEKQVKIPVILIKTPNNLLGLKNMIGLLQRINKISHPKGNFAHRQFSVLVGDLHTSVCLLWWWMGRGGGSGWGGLALEFFWSYQQQQGHGASIMTWPPLPPACTWMGPTSGSNFPFSFVDHLTMCFPRLWRMSSHSWSTSGLYTPASSAPMHRLLTTECMQHIALSLRNEHILYCTTERRRKAMNQGLQTYAELKSFFAKYILYILGVWFYFCTSQNCDNKIVITKEKKFKLSCFSAVIWAPLILVYHS